MAKFLLPVICVLLAMVLSEFISDTTIQVSPSKWGGIPHIVVTKLYSQLARIQLITKSALSTAQTKSRSRATKSPFTGHKKSLTGDTSNNPPQTTLTSSWNPHYASWAPAPLDPYDWNNKKSITSPFIRNTAHTNHCHTENRDLPNQNHIQQPPDHRPYLKYGTRGRFGKIGSTDKYHSHHDTETASQKYENYLREYTLHRNKCIDIIRTAFQDIRDEIQERESRRTNNTTSRTSQYIAHSETEQLNYLHRVQHTKHTEHQLTTQDKIPHRVNTHTTCRVKKETESGPEHRD